MQTFPPSQLPPRGAGPVPILLSLFSLFSFALPRYVGEFLAFWEVWGLLPAFSRCSVGVVPRVDVFLMYFWEEGDLHVLLLCRLEGPSSIITY